MQRLLLFLLLFSVSCSCAFGQTTFPRRPIPKDLEMPEPGRQTYTGDEAAKEWAKVEANRQLIRPRTSDEQPETVGIIPRGAADGIVYRCFFDQRTDQNQDDWPDGWTRQPGIGFPQYVNAEIVRNETPVNLRAMQIDVEGGNEIGRASCRERV